MASGLPEYIELAKGAIVSAMPLLMKPRWVGAPPLVDKFAKDDKPPALRSSAKELTDPVSVSSVAYIAIGNLEE